MDTITLLENLRSIAQNGLTYSRDPYDRERYQQLWELTTRTYRDLLNMPREDIHSTFLREFGYITPKVGSSAAIFNPRGELLLIDRSDGLGWCLPCGWVEPNEKPIDTAVREVKEETNLDVEVIQLVGVFSRKASLEKGLHSLVSICHLCRVVEGDPNLSHEGKALAYLPYQAVENWAPGHLRYARAAHTLWASQDCIPSISD